MSLLCSGNIFVQFNVENATLFVALLVVFRLCVCVSAANFKVRCSTALFTAVTGETAIFLAKRLCPLPP